MHHPVPCLSTQITERQNRIFISVFLCSRNTSWHCSLVVCDHLVEVLGQLGGEVLVPKSAKALGVEDVGDGGDQQQLLLGVGLGEAVDAEGVQHHRGTSGLLVSQVPRNQTDVRGYSCPLRPCRPCRLI